MPLTLPSWEFATPVLTELTPDMQYPELLRGLIAAWSPHLSPAKNKVLTDLSGRGRHGLLTNMEITDWTMIEGRQALSCGGTDEHISATIGTLLQSKSHVTLAGWMYQASTSESTAIGLLDNAGKRFELLADLGATIYSTNYGNYDTISKNLVGWHHYAIAYNGNLPNTSRHRTFFDGIDVSTGTYTSDSTLPAFDSTGNISIGRDQNGGYRYWVGSYGDVLVWNRTLQDREIAQLYYLGPGGWATRRPSRQRVVAGAAPSFTGKTFRAMRLAR